MPRLLVLALENWLGAASLPRALNRAGFEVSLLCYPNTLVSLTKYATDRDLCMPNDTAEVVARRISNLIEGSAGDPIRLIIPADDRALRFMQHMVEVANLGQLPKQLVALVRASLPDETAFKYGNDKEAASALMHDLGFRTPRRTLIWDVCELTQFVSEIGLPAVVKPIAGTAGAGVQIIRTDEDLRRVSIPAGERWLAQKYVSGKIVGCASVALDGKYLGSLIFEKTLTYPGETGPASVATRIECDEISRAAAAYAKATKFTGFYSPGFMLEEGSGDAYFLEVNARPVPMTPASGKLGFDLCRALYAKMVGAPAPKLDSSAPPVMAFYPQELHRDPNSPHRSLMFDEPTDDPLVHHAMQRGIELMAASQL